MGGSIGFRTIPLNEAAQAAVAWFKKNWWRTLIVSAASFIVAWLWNMWLMAYRLEGHRVDPGRGGTTATADGKGYNTIYWLLVTTVGFGLFAYARERGFKTMLQELAAAPNRMLASLTKRPNITVGMFLWGMSLSLIVAVVLTQAMSGVLAIGFIVAAPSLFANLINNFFIRVWTAVLANFAPQSRHEVEGIASPLTVMLGQGAGMVLAFLMGDSLFGSLTIVIKILLALALAGLSYAVVMLGNRPTPSSATMVFLVVGGGLVALKLAHPGIAFADDGGWRECSYNGHLCGGVFGFYQWFRSSGAGVVISRSFLGGFGAAFGAVLGAGLGGTVGSLSNALSPSAQVDGGGGGSGGSGGSVQTDPGRPGDGSGGAGGGTAQPGGGEGSRILNDVLPEFDRIEEEEAAAGVVGAGAGAVAGTDPGGGPGQRMLNDVLPDADKVEDEAAGTGGTGAGGSGAGAGAGGSGAGAGAGAGAGVSAAGAGGAGAEADPGGGPGRRMFDDVLPDADKVEEETSDLTIAEGVGLGGAAPGGAAGGGAPAPPAEPARGGGPSARGGGPSARGSGSSRTAGRGRKAGGASGAGSAGGAGAGQSAAPPDATLEAPAVPPAVPPPPPAPTAAVPPPPPEAADTASMPRMLADNLPDADKTDKADKKRRRRRGRGDDEPIV